MNVGELRKLLEGYDDNVEVLIWNHVFSYMRPLEYNVEEWTVRCVPDKKAYEYWKYGDKALVLRQEE